MSLADSPTQRQRWAAKAQTTINTIEDLRRELTIAVRQQPALYLVEADVHLTIAQTEIEEAVSRVQRQH
jgi:hypothetical protein